MKYVIFKNVPAKILKLDKFPDEKYYILVKRLDNDNEIWVEPNELKEV